MFDQNSLSIDSQKNPQISSNKTNGALINQRHWKLKIVNQKKLKMRVSEMSHHFYSAVPIYVCFLVATIVPRIISE